MSFRDAVVVVAVAVAVAVASDAGVELLTSRIGTICLSPEVTNAL